MASDTPHHVQDELRYGALFIQHIKSLSHETPFCFHDLQQIRELTREQLAERFERECSSLTETIRTQPPEAAAAIFHQKRGQHSASAGDFWLVGDAAASLIDLLISVFSD
ncbi:MAG: hypothetical protein ACKO2P_12885 [Planctomycetota bacterium]